MQDREAINNIFIPQTLYNPMSSCEMKGFLSFLLLWLVSKEAKTGAEIGIELQKRKGCKPSPGTIYPALKELKEKGLLSIDEHKRYSLTKKGKDELQELLGTFFETFCDIDEMKKRKC